MNNLSNITGTEQQLIMRDGIWHHYTARGASGWTSNVFYSPHFARGAYEVPPVPRTLVQLVHDHEGVWTITSKRGAEGWTCTAKFATSIEELDAAVAEQRPGL